MSVQIFFIYANNCPHCIAAEEEIEWSITESGIECEVHKFLFNSKVALNIARKNGIDDLPGFVIGESVFVGDNYSREAIIEAIQNANRRK